MQSRIMKNFGILALKKTCTTAFAVRTGSVVGRRPILSPTGILTSPTTRLRLSSSTSFQPPNPPGTHGTPVFPDIDFSVSSLQAIKRNSDPAAVFCVTGSNRGIGLQFVKSLAERTKGTIVACCRSPQTATALSEFASTLDNPKRIKMVSLDLEDQVSIETAGTEIRNNFDRVDLLLNVAGILGDSKTTPGPERSLQKMDRAWFEKTLAVNLIGPVMFSKELVPLIVQRRRKKATDESSGRPPAIVANLSARVGSISDNALGGWYSYRMSKSALNQATRTMALELKRQSAWCISLHPGTTDTGLSKPFQANVKKESLFPVDFTVTKLLNVIDSMDEEHSGGFYDWAGRAISF